jgi:hypothetical protein
MEAFAMSRALLILANDTIRDKAIRWVRGLPKDTRIEFKAPKRTTPQNAKLWAMLTEVSGHVVWYGQKLSADDWKDVFTASLRKARVVPGLDAGTYVPLGMRTSDMSKQELGELLELVAAFGAQQGVEFHEQEPR